MLKGKKMIAPTDVVFIDGCQSGGIIDRSRKLLLSWDDLDLAFDFYGNDVPPANIKERHDRTFNQPEPVKSTVSNVNKRKYLKLYNGDVYCVESNTILDRHSLEELLLSL